MTCLGFLIVFVCLFKKERCVVMHVRCDWQKRGRHEAGGSCFATHHQKARDRDRQQIKCSDNSDTAPCRSNEVTLYVVLIRWGHLTSQSSHWLTYFIAALLKAAISQHRSLVPMPAKMPVGAAVCLRGRGTWLCTVLTVCCWPIFPPKTPLLCHCLAMFLLMLKNACIF